MSLRIYGNRPLKTLPGQATRPTLARVREAVFNIWQGSIEGCRWLDLCAGTGSMGAEALCRGAAHVVGIERSSRACAVVRQNWGVLAEAEQYQIICGDVLKKLPTLAGQPFDLIYFDPPYTSDLYQPALAAIVQFSLLAADGEVAVEHSPERSDFLNIEHLKICCQKVYGNTALTFLQLANREMA